MNNCTVFLTAKTQYTDGYWIMYELECKFFPLLFCGGKDVELIAGFV